MAAQQGVIPLKDVDEPHRVIDETYAFATESGNMDIYYESLVDYDQALPKWEPCNEIYADNPLREKYPLQFANVRTRFQIHEQFQNAEWIQQFYTPTVDINPSEMAKRGLKTGDAVTIKNDRGYVKVRVKGNEAIRPGSARIYENAMGDYTLEGNMQSLTNDTMIERGYSLMVGPVTPFSDTLVEIEKA